jgi:malate dehydrogenase (oxaloacetate-decarboxylating)(NADP+)
MDLKERALKYHSEGQPGKLAIVATKPCQTSEDLSLAYTPGVATPVMEIANNPEDSFKYTNRGNLVAVVSNGTAILGLGNQGALASKPVMEGKGVLFKRFADVDVFDIELDTEDPDKIIETVKLMEPTFGGINLEDIKAPDCFRIENELKKITNIPIFHDDQHGTAIISAAGLLNALEINGKKIEEIKVVFNGAGAAGISCARLFVELGVKKENLVMCDSKGVIYNGRPGTLNPEKEEFAADTELRSLEDAMSGCDVFVGVSVKDSVTPAMLKSMNSDPIVFAMANPTPEIMPEKIQGIARIIATGRSDYPNQINNVLAFPGLFRGALDARATDINEEMKLAAAYAIANCIDENDVSEEYIVPSVFNKQVVRRVAKAVKEAARKSGVARK